MKRLPYFNIILAILAPWAAAGAAEGPANQTLSIAVLQGEGAVNNLRSGMVTPPIVEVRDESLRPVAGAEVVFQLPSFGPGGTFAGGAMEARAKTNAAGQAGAPQFELNEKEGHYYIDVTARLGERMGKTRILQANSVKLSSSGPVATRGKSKAWKILAIAAGGALTAGIILLAGGGDDHEHTTVVVNAPTISLTPGTITVGGPR